MQENSEEGIPRSERTTIVVATLVLLLLALFAPYMVAYQDLLGSTRYLVAAVTWSFINQSGETTMFLPHPGWILFVPVVGFPRLFFVFAINRSLTRKSQPGEFFLASALIVFQQLAMCVFFYFNPFYIELVEPGGPLIIRPAPPIGSTICIPAPILLCIGLVVLGWWETKLSTMESRS